MHTERVYRNWVKGDDLVEFKVAIKETDLFIRAQRDLSAKAAESIKQVRTQIEDYIAADPEFRTTLTPYKVNGNSPSIVKEMSIASSLVGVGPFASVAGTIAEYVGKDLLKYSSDVIIENGGDIFIKSLRDRNVAVFAGSSSFNKKIAIEIKAKSTPLGICTSAGSVGHSLSFGKADAVAVVSNSSALADAAATRIGNIIKNKEDITKGIEFAKGIKDIKGVIIIKDDKMGVWGDLRIRRI